MARFNFRQGIARRQQDGLGNPNNLQPSSGGSWIDLIVSPDPTIFIIAHYDTDYMFTENATITQAWGPFTAGNDYWLYWNIDFQSGELTRGYTRKEPADGPTPPSNPTHDQHWFDTNEMVMKTWVGGAWGRWIERIRVFAAKYQGGATIIDYPLGSQVGVSGFDVHAGKVLYDPDGKPLQVFQRNRRGQFITTETPMHSQFSRIANFRVEAAIVQGEALEHIPIHHAVAYSDYNQLILARNSDINHPAIGVSTEDMVTGEIRSYITKGFIRDEVNWDWSAHPVNTPLFVGPTGNLLTEPEAGALTQQEIGYIVDETTIFVNIQQFILLEPPLGNEIVYHLDRDTGALIARKVQISLEDLVDVEVWNPQEGDVIVWNETQNQWVLESNCCGGGGAQELNDLTDVITMPDEGDHLVFRGSWWVNEPPPSGGGLTWGLFVTDVTTASPGIVGDYVYAPNTVPPNTVVTEATSDQSLVRVHFIVEGDGSMYSPTVTVDVGVGDVPGVLTQDPQDIRTFHGYADVTIADGLTAGRTVLLEASHGATAQVLIKRAPEPAEIQSMVFDNIYPAVPADPTSGYPGGTQSTIKAGDYFYVTGTVDNSATLVVLDTGGAVGAGTFTTSTPGSNLGAADSGGVGVRTFSIRFQAGSASGSQTASASAQNAFGTFGSTYTTTNVVVLDQAPPNVNISSVDYPGIQMALKAAETATVNNSVSGHDYVYYYENGGAGFINITNPTTLEVAKVVTRTGGSYLYDGDNFAIRAYKTSNGTMTTEITDVNISNVAPSVDITGASSRLISSPSGENYVITLTFSQRLLQAPTIVSSGDPTAGDRGVWSGGGDVWSFTITVDDSDVKDVYSWTVNNVNTLSNNTYNAITITSGGSYEIGGFTLRNVVVGALEQVVDLGVDLSDPSKVIVRYAGTADILTYRGANLTQFQKGWSAVDGSQLVYTPGPDPFPNYSNFVFQDPSVTPTSWLFLTDADFAGTNTTGTLTLEIEETA